MQKIVCNCKIFNRLLKAHKEKSRWCGFYILNIKLNPSAIFGLNACFFLFLKMPPLLASAGTAFSTGVSKFSNSLILFGQL